MSDIIPEDICKKAEYLCGFLEAMPSVGNFAAIAEALMAERERAAKIAEDMWDEMAEDVAIAIRSGDRP